MATTMTLAEQNHAEELKRVCLEFVSKNLSAVMVTEGYQHMMSSCPTLQVRCHLKLLTTAVAHALLLMKAIDFSSC